MKVRFFALSGVMTIIIITILLMISADHRNSNKSNPNSTKSTPTIEILPTVTQTPVVHEENDPGIYPTYKIIDNEITYGYINSKGEYVINPAFRMANDFHDGYAVVYMGNQYLLIDTTGNIIYTSNNMIRDFNNGACVISNKNVNDTLYGYVNGQGKEIIPAKYVYAGDFSKDKTAYVYQGNGEYLQIDQTGKTLNQYKLNPKYNPIDIEDGYIIYYNSKTDCYGVINFNEEVVFKAIYSEITYMDNQLFAVKKPNSKFGGMSYANPAALFHADGSQITDYTLYDISSFHYGYASVTDSKYTYFIDMQGKEATNLPKYEGRGTLTYYGDIIKASLDRDLIYYKLDGTIVWQNDTTQKLSEQLAIKQSKYKPNKYAVIYYPSLIGLSDSSVQNKINSKLKSIFVNTRKNLKESDLLSVEDTFHSKLLKNLLVIERDGYDFPFGAAHGMPIMDYHYIDLQNGNLYTLKDLFIQNSDYILTLNNIIKAQIVADNASDSIHYFENGFKGISPEQPFILNDHSLTIYFSPYDIAPYAAGFPKFEIPFDDINQYINMDGSFWKSFH